MILHVDANSFYASCERLFRPDLAEKPIVVLSNNDGIIIALNAEAKTSGFKRGDAWFKVSAECAQKDVTVFSSNYTLYADISARIVAVYNRLCPDVEVYSIDECFLYYPDWNCPDFDGIAHHIRNTVLREIGIPVSVGIAPTRTLAKVCNKLAKKGNGVFSTENINIDLELANIPVGDIWGIGGSKKSTLERQGIYTALDLKNYPLHKAKKGLTITGMRTVQELNCIPANERIEPKKNQNICSSKSFAEPVTTLVELEQATAAYTHEAVRRLRAQNSRTRFLSVYLMTNPWDDTGPQYCNQLSADLSTPSSYLPDILDTALGLLRNLYREGFRYRKVMITLLGLEDDVVSQQTLFEDDSSKPGKQALMRCFDTINERYGKNTMRTALHLPGTSPWSMRRKFLSPAYTTDITGIPDVF
ncbi:MAG TPA: Y-family DNA polymerase [Treponema sp.]|nr:Y-family DNA polymerase [Treponema sp.]